MLLDISGRRRPNVSFDRMADAHANFFLTPYLVLLYEPSYTSLNLIIKKKLSLLRRPVCYLIGFEWTCSGVRSITGPVEAQAVA